MEMDQLVVLDRLPNGVAKITLNNPPYNLVTLELTGQLIEVLEEAEKEQKIRAIVFTGAGEKAFCAGSDIKEFPSVWGEVIEKKLKKENEAFSMIEYLTKPTIAAIEGIACGGGCEIALACDIRIMSDQAKIGLPEVKLGVFPGSGGVFRLPRLVGPARAMELMYRGNFVSAAEAERIGLVNHVAQAGRVLDEAMKLAEELARQPTEAMKQIKYGVRASFLLSHDENVDLTLTMSDHVFKTEDCAEGVKAFFEKRQPRFKGVSE